VAILIVVFAIFTSVWTDRLWYGTFGYGSVFSKMLLTRIGLFVSFGLIMATLVVANAAIAYRLRPRLGAQIPTSPLLERYREMLESRSVSVTARTLPARVTHVWVAGHWSRGILAWFPGRGWWRNPLRWSSVGPVT
jgi:uncharacterized membrane protein (UPF0182 family)